MGDKADLRRQLAKVTTDFKPTFLRGSPIRGILWWASGRTYLHANVIEKNMAKMVAVTVRAIWTTLAFHLMLASHLRCLMLGAGEFREVVGGFASPEAVVGTEFEGR